LINGEVSYSLCLDHTKRYVFLDLMVYWMLWSVPFSILVLVGVQIYDSNLPGTTGREV